MWNPENLNPQTENPNFPIKTRLSLSLVSLLTDNAQLPDGSVNRCLLRLLNIRFPAVPFPFLGVSTSDFSVDPSRNLWFRLFSPAGDISGDRLLPVVVFFHGGGFAFLSPSFFYYDFFCRRLSRGLNAHVLSVNYRLAPEHRFPSQYDDGSDVLEFLDANGEKMLPLNADLTKCFLAGDSAGGNLAHHVAVRSGRYGGFRSLKLAGIVSINPFFGGEERTESEKRLVDAPIVSLNRSDWCWKAFLPAGSNRDHGAANVTGPNLVDISGLDYPETLVIVSGFDPLQDWQRRYYKWLKQSGVRATLIEYPNMMHAFNMFPELAESGKLIMQIKDFIDSVTQKNECMK